MYARTVEGLSVWGELPHTQYQYLERFKTILLVTLSWGAERPGWLGRQAPGAGLGARNLGL